MAYIKYPLVDNETVIDKEILDYMQDGIAEAHERLGKLQESAGGGSVELIGISKRHFIHAGFITSQGVVDDSTMNGTGKAHTDIILIDILADGPEGHCVQDFDTYYTYPKVLFFSGDTLDTFISGVTRDEFGDKDVLTVAEIKALAPSHATHVAFNSDYEEEASIEDFVYVRGTSLELDATLSYEGRAADAKAVGDADIRLGNAINRNEKRLEKLEGATIRAVYTEAEMDEILEYAASEPDEGWFYYTGEYYYMYVGEASEKYKKGAVYKLKGVV